jgi:hypothetical protein
LLRYAKNSLLKSLTTMTDLNTKDLDLTLSEMLEALQKGEQLSVNIETRAKELNDDLDAMEKEIDKAEQEIEAHGEEVSEEIKTSAAALEKVLEADEKEAE